MLGSRDLESAKSTICAATIHMLLLGAEAAHVIVHGWLLLHSCKHIHLLLLRLWRGTEWAKTSVVLRLLLLLLLVARIKSSLPLVGPCVLLLRHTKITIHVVWIHTLSLLLLLHSAIEELGLETTVTGRLLLVGHCTSSKWIQRRLLRRCLLLHHLHLLHLCLALLLGIVPIAHDLECRVFRIRGMGLRVLIHHMH